MPTDQPSLIIWCIDISTLILFSLILITLNLIGLSVSKINDLFLKEVSFSNINEFKSLILEEDKSTSSISILLSLSTYW